MWKNNPAVTYSATKHQGRFFESLVSGLNYKASCFQVIQNSAPRVVRQRDIRISKTPSLLERWKYVLSFYQTLLKEPWQNVYNLPICTFKIGRRITRTNGSLLSTVSRSLEKISQIIKSFFTREIAMTKPLLMLILNLPHIYILLIQNCLI